MRLQGDSPAGSYSVWMGNGSAGQEIYPKWHTSWIWSQAGRSPHRGQGEKTGPKGGMLLTLDAGGRKSHSLVEKRLGGEDYSGEHRSQLKFTVKNGARHRRMETGNKNTGSLKVKVWRHTIEESIQSYWKMQRWCFISSWRIHWKSCPRIFETGRCLGAISLCSLKEFLWTQQVQKVFDVHKMIPNRKPKNGSWI